MAQTGRQGLVERSNRKQHGRSSYLTEIHEGNFHNHAYRSDQGRENAEQACNNICLIRHLAMSSFFSV